MNEKYTDYKVTFTIRLKGDNPLSFHDWVGQAIEEQLENNEFIDEYTTEILE